VHCGKLNLNGGGKKIRAENGWNMCGTITGEGGRKKKRKGIHPHVGLGQLSLASLRVA